MWENLSIIVKEIVTPCFTLWLLMGYRWTKPSHAILGDSVTMVIGVSSPSQLGTKPKVSFLDDTHSTCDGEFRKS